MNWNNFGEIWQLDHVLPISRFDMTNESDKNVCFHWTNFQPLYSIVNRQKSNSIQLHYYFNTIVSVFRFNKIHCEYLGYQAVGESLQWIRSKLMYGKNAPYDVIVKTTTEIDNQQPSL